MTALVRSCVSSLGSYFTYSEYALTVGELSEENSLRKRNKLKISFTRCCCWWGFQDLIKPLPE